MTLTADHIKKLRAPYTPEAVKWRADQKTPDKGGRVRCLVYIDSRLAMERLSDVDPNWTAAYTFIASTPNDPLGLANYAPTACKLTVLGLTREDVGQIQSKNADGKSAKSALSDALKRAAVQFGVGQYLYAMPVFHASEGGYWLKGSGEVGGLTPRGIKELRGVYETIVNHEKFQERFGAPTDYGDVADDERSATPEYAQGELVPIGPNPSRRTRRP